MQQHKHRRMFRQQLGLIPNASFLLPLDLQIIVPEKVDCAIKDAPEYIVTELTLTAFEAMG